MRDCSSKKIGYSSESSAISALLEAHQKSNFEINNGPQNIYRCSICDQYHLTSKKPSHAILKQNSTIANETIKNDIQRWTNKFKNFKR
ncbi:MAG: hypothetical protein LC105_12375 [Chitinophagales bacterium]|nr:hypothetical protein [Chitinophagales bacterium]MCZ2394648.1 hypothetical protein [Chitinophagales bacterium]